jgi:type I restriction enzyme R subunit/putative DNA methylase
MEYYRNLPHFHPESASLFVTFRLYGTLPLPSVSDGSDFAAADRELERTPTGADWLKQPQIAECVTEIIRQGETIRALCNLLAFVVMPNHVHMLIEPDAPLPKITQYVKGVSAKKANELLDRTGQPFWQDESFDHWVRTKKERRNIIRYIEFNPVRANLAAEPTSFRYSSAFAQSQTPAQAQTLRWHRL